MTAFVFFYFQSAGEGEGWFKGDFTWLIQLKKNKKKHRQPPSCIVKLLKTMFFMEDTQKQMKLSRKVIKHPSFASFFVCEIKNN